MHKILEYMISGRNWSLSLEAAKDSYTLTSVEFERIESYRMAACNFIDRLGRYKDRHSIKEVWVEKKMGVNLWGKAVPFFDKSVFFRGIVDLAMFPHEQNYAIVLDHKTGKQRSLKHYEQQFDGYMLLVKAAVPTLAAGKIGIHWVKEDRVELSKLDRNLEDVQPYREQLVGWLNEITANIADFEKTKRSPLCPWCDHQSVCPEFREGSAEDDGQRKEDIG